LTHRKVMRSVGWTMVPEIGDGQHCKIVDFKAASTYFMQMKHEVFLLTGFTCLPHQNLSNNSFKDNTTHGVIHLKNCTTQLAAAGMPNLLYDWFVDAASRQITHDLIPCFWASFPDRKPDPAKPAILPSPQDPSFERRCLLLLHDAVVKLHKDAMPIYKTAELIDQLGAKGRCERVITETLVGVLTTSPKLTLFPVIRSAYKFAFNAFHTLKAREDLGDEEDETFGDTDSLNETMTIFERIHSKLNDLDLVDALTGDAVSFLCHSHIRSRVRSASDSSFDSPLLEELNAWIQNSLFPRHLFCPLHSWKQERAQKHAEDVIERLSYFMYESLADARICQLFDIIVEFPDSKAALEDLRECMSRVTDMRPRLIVSLKSALETRLLHPGVNTTEILTFYIEAIRALRFLDPPGVILESVCEPVRSYLRQREDTVRCIVQSLTDESSGSELAMELFASAGLCEMDDAGAVGAAEAADIPDTDWQTWMPDPVDADPNKSSKQRRSADIISMLVNIYGSRELFVNAYRTLLADRILTATTFDLDRERRHLELLKRRFGESQMHYCEVILKDVDDSARINKHIQEAAQKSLPQEARHDDIPMSAYVISGQFWPPLREEKVKLPEDMEKAMATFTKSYEALKGNRTLHWRPHLGFVDMVLELKDGKKLMVDVSPVHAAIIKMFEDQECWTTEALATQLGMTTTSLRRRIALWQSHGLVKEDPQDVWTLHEDRPLSGGAVLAPSKTTGSDTQVFVLDPDDEVEPATATAQDLKEEEMNLYWTYVEGMLRNIESLPLERIHSMLKMFTASSPGSGGSSGTLELDELKSFLAKKVKEQKLLLVSGVYRLPGK